MKESEIESLATMAEGIVSKEIALQKAKKGHSFDANKRITALNFVWTKMSLVCQCAKLLFQNDATRYNLFLLNDSVTPASMPVPTPAMQGELQ